MAFTLGLSVLLISTLSAQDRDLVLAPKVPQGRRLALVIGNDTYLDFPMLSNARNDARSMAQALRRLSFDVTAVEDGTRASIGSAVLAFSRRLTGSDLAFVFYAGHGVQVEGINYLIPVDFKGRSEDEARLNAVSTDEVTRALQRARVAVPVLDALPEQPFFGRPALGKPRPRTTRSTGLLVTFATGAGKTASDGPIAGNGIYTSELLQVLGAPGLGLRDTFFEVQRRVHARTKGEQFPAVNSQLIDDVVLTPVKAAPVGSASVPTAAALAMQAELGLWDAIKESRSAAAFEDYLKRYPSGQFRIPAEERLRAARAVAPPADTSARRAGEIRRDPLCRGWSGPSSPPGRSRWAVPGVTLNVRANHTEKLSRFLLN